MPTDHPAIRALEVQRVADANGRGIVLVDRLGISEPTFIPEGLLPIVGRCTGERTLEQIRGEAEVQYEDAVSLEQVAQLVQQLDERLLLLGPRYDAAVAAAAEAFVATGTRPASHAGSAGYPAEREALQAALDELLRPTTAAATTGPTPPRGLIAPHIDLARGAAGYAAAYRALLTTEPADLYVIFGTGHAGSQAPVTGLPLDWQTPLGTTPTDRDFVAAIEAHTGAADPLDLLVHKGEHSLEFQVLFLQHLHQRRSDRPFRVAAFLCGELPSAAGDPLGESWLQQLLAAFRAAEAATTGRVCYLAGADLAHIGPFFGDEEPITDARLQHLATAEQARLALLQGGQPGPFHAAVTAAQNPDRVCSAPAITLCAALAGGPGNLLHYGQARAHDDSQTVSFCAMTFAGA